MKRRVVAGEFRQIYNPSLHETEAWYINDHCFIQDKCGLWHMFGITQTEPAKPLEEKSFAHATSRTLCNPQWEKQEHVLHTDPSWKETHVWAPHIVFHDDTYYMFYCAGGESNDKYRIHLAASQDLWNWKRHEANPMVIDGFDARDPMVINHEGLWIMYYTATSTPAGGHHTVETVTSTNLVEWGNKQRVFTHLQTGTFGGPTESPFVIQRNGHFYLMVCTNDPYNTSAIYESDTPFGWSIDNVVGEFPTHASEIILHEGQYYISRAGWGEGGLYLAKLDWV